MDNIFTNTRAAFSLKSDRELERAYYLFKMIQSPALVSMGTALTKFALNLHLPVEGLIRNTVFDHLCGGTTKEDCLPVMDRMHGKGVSSVLDYSVEGKEDDASFDDAMNMTLRIIDFAVDNPAIPFAVFKPTGFGRLALYEKIGEGTALTDSEKIEWERVVSRYEKVFERAAAKDICVMVDAEESWMQDAADDLVEGFMKKYNTNKALIFNTLQMYRHDRMEYLRGLHHRANEQGFHIGMKLVRGAYMEKERERALEKGYPSPICATKQATDENYDAAVLYMMRHLDRMAIFAGTHNEESSYRLMQLMSEHGVDKRDRRIWFGQLYGMSDNISFNLAEHGYNVAKYLPFGPVREVMPYLIRRAEENTSVEGQTSRELFLIEKERERRRN